MVNQGLPEAWAKGPVLAEAQYPQVIVARAVSDGAALNLVLYPGAEPGIAALGLGRLVPGRSYRSVQSGVQFKAGPDGRHNLAVKLDGRTEVDIVPVM